MSYDLKLFEHKAVRTHWDEEQETWYFNVTDVIDVLTESADAKQYIKKMRKRDPELDANWGTICTPVKMVAKDGKKRNMLAANTEGLLRLIQSIPSPKAEPFKQWLAQVGNERLDEIIDPEIAINRAISYYQQKGYSDKWISQRIKCIEVRKDLTDQWHQSGVQEGREYAILTNELTKSWSDLTVPQYKAVKNLKKENLRDNMTNMELVLNMLAEVTTTELSKVEQPQGFNESKLIVRRGGKVAKNARENIEAQTGRSVISSLNAQTMQGLEEGGDVDE